MPRPAVVCKHTLTLHLTSAGILAHYYGYNLKFVQNITDVDDKIILRGRQAHLLSNFKTQNPTITEEVIQTTIKAFDAYVKKNLPLLDANVNIGSFNQESAEKYANVIHGKSVDGGPPSDKEAKIKMHLRTASTAVTSLLAPLKTTPEDIELFYAGAEDVLLPYLDSLYGSTIDASDHTVFTKLTQKYEARFNEDMRSLNVLEPDVVTRVTEYGPQIVEFVEKIVKNGCAYQTKDGSVYFDIESFEKRAAGNHYARLEPWNRNDTGLQADGEGALSTLKTSEKRSESDFALWKSSKPGEPAWQSPWGPGRPGWHIECSVMASAVLGEQMDIHSGGIDLCFPHHDNELAQSEAYWQKDGGGGAQWVNYFLHMGHLSISGSKMSKSLKNFTTIREALGRGEWTARSLRIIFLLGGWHDGIEITPDLRKAGSSWESYVTNFFLKVRDLEIHPNISSTGSEDQRILDIFEASKAKVHEALADSFDTPTAIRAISGLITEYNSVKASLTDAVSFDLARYVTRMVRIFGLDNAADPYDGGIGWAGTDIPVSAKEFVYAVSRERDEVRQHAIAGDLSDSVLDSIIAQHKPKPAQKQDIEAVPYAEVLSTFQENLQGLASKQAPAKDYLDLCDQLRDTHLWDLGIYLEDREGAPAMVRPVDAELREARDQKEAIARQKAEAKLKRETEEAEKKVKLAEQAKISPNDMFRTGEYSAWDEEGMPTKDNAGADVAKGRVKKLRKEWDKQKKLYEEHLKA
jgi:cysteinyl-tRNA synthetase